MQDILDTMLIFIGALLLISLVILHELGHYVAAKRSGIEVEEFGIGFPPKAATIGRRNGTEYTLNWLPLGGFVKLKGEHDSDTEPGSFGAASLGAKVRVMVAGVLVNIITAVFLLSIISLFGMPQAINNQFNVASDSKVVRQEVVMSVAKDSVADSMGLKSGDKIVSIKPVSCIDESCVVTIKESAELSVATSSLAGQEIEIEYITKAGEQSSAVGTLLSEEEVTASKEAYRLCIEAGELNSKDCPQSKGFLGVVPSDNIEKQATWSAPLVGLVTTGQFVQATFSGLGGIVADLFEGDTSSAAEQTTGVVGIGYILSDLSSRGFISVLFLTALISISLAVMNILPIPALDGGRLFVTLLFRVLRLPLSKKTEERIHGSGFVVLMLLFLLITVLDVQRYILK